MIASITNFFEINSEYLQRKSRKTTDVRLPEKGRKLVCRRCGALITLTSEAISINGEHIYTRINPGGVEFTFACYQRAPGCKPWGEACNQHSWFANHSWQIAVCEGCTTHLGWIFRNSKLFHGLIIGRLHEN